MGFLDDHFLDQYTKKPNRVRIFQDFFQKGNKPVFLKTKADVTLYRALMGSSLFGLGVAFYYLGKMATGTMKNS